MVVLSSRGDELLSPGQPRSHTCSSSIQRIFWFNRRRAAGAGVMLHRVTTWTVQPVLLHSVNYLTSASPFSDERYIRQQRRGRNMTVLRCSHSCSARCLHPPALLLRPPLTSSLTCSQPPPLSLSAINTHADTQTLTHPLVTHQSIRSQRCRPSMSVVGVSPATTASPCQTWESAFFFCYLFGFWRMIGHALLCGCCVCTQTGVRGHVDAWKRNTTN